MRWKENPEVVSLFHNARTTTQRYRAYVTVPSSWLKQGWFWWLSYFSNAVAGVESAAHGGYDAFNTGGSNGGRTAYGSGNSSKDNALR